MVNYIYFFIFLLINFSFISAWNSYFDLREKNELETPRTVFIVMLILNFAAIWLLLTFLEKL